MTSGKGGVGKTTVTANIGRKLSELGFSVVLVDADVGLNNLDVVVGIENRVVYDMLDIINSKCTIKQALVDDFDSDMKVLSSSKNSNLISSQAFRCVVDNLSMFDFVLIDCPAGIDGGFHRAVSSADEALIVTNPSSSAIRDADKVVSLMFSYSLSSVSLVVNRLRADLIRSGDMLSAMDISKLLRVSLIGAVPEDDCITVFQQVGRSHRSFFSDKYFETIAKNIAYGERNIRDIKRSRPRLRMF